VSGPIFGTIPGFLLIAEKGDNVQHPGSSSYNKKTMEHGNFFNLQPKRRFFKTSSAIRLWCFSRMGWNVNVYLLILTPLKKGPKTHFVTQLTRHLQDPRTSPKRQIVHQYTVEQRYRIAGCVSAGKCTKDSFGCAYTKNS
jgi:hypothetical protein